MEKINKSAELKQILKKNKVSFAYLFGSQASGEVDKNSDIDIAVMLPLEMEKRKRFDIRLKLMGDISKVFGKNVDIVVLNDTSSLFFKYIIIKEGEVIYRETELSPADFESKTLGMYFDFRPFLEEYNKAYVKRNLQ